MYVADGLWVDKGRFKAKRLSRPDLPHVQLADFEVEWQLTWNERVYDQLSIFAKKLVHIDLDLSWLASGSTLFLGRNIDLEAFEKD